MLIGEYAHNVDPKGRVIFPAKLREDLGIQFILTRGLDNCLFVYSTTEWAEIQEKTKNLPMSKARAVQRFLFSSACVVEPDKQGRILIPQNLREHAGIDKDVMIIGVSTRAEIWDKAAWEAECAKLSPDLVAEAMDDLGF